MVLISKRQGLFFTRKYGYPKPGEFYVSTNGLISNYNGKNQAPQMKVLLLVKGKERKSAARKT